MDKKSIKESADIIYRICSKNGDNRLTGYFSSSPTNMWLNSEGNLELKCVVREKNTVFETIGTVLDNSVIMKQIQQKEKETYYDLISWTASGEECTVVNLNNLEDLDKSYKDIEEKQKVFVGLTNIEKIFSDLDIKYNRWDQDLYKYLLRIKEITDTYKNPLINDSGGASICNDIDKKVDELIKMVLFK